MSYTNPDGSINYAALAAKLERDCNNLERDATRVITALVHALREERRLSGVECACTPGYHCVSCEGAAAIAAAEAMIGAVP